MIMMVVWAPLGWYLGRDAVPLWGAVEWGFVVASGSLPRGAPADSYVRLAKAAARSGAVLSVAM